MWRIEKSNIQIGIAGGALQIGAYWIIVWALAIASIRHLLGVGRHTFIALAANARGPAYGNPLAYLGLSRWTGLG